jgi:quercetin dioxygenase-like cupin family protein
VRLDTAGASWDGSQGDLLVIPPARHGLTALEGAVVSRGRLWRRLRDQ